MAELGLFGANLPEEYGCAGLNNVAYGLIMQELERGDSGIRSFASVQGGLVMYPIYAFGSEEQKKHWLPRLASGQDDRLLRPHRARLRLEPRRHDHRPRGRTKDGWVLNGAKMWITNGIAGHGRPSSGPRRGPSTIRSPSAASSCRPIPRALPPATRRASCRSAPRTPASSRCRMCLSRRMPSSRRRGGLKSPLMCLTQARYGIAWGARRRGDGLLRGSGDATPRTASCSTGRSRRRRSSRSGWPTC